MGSSNSTSQVQPGGILIYVDSPSFHPGDIVIGNVYLEMTQSFSSSSLQLSLKVNQCTKFREDFLDNRTRLKRSSDQYIESQISLFNSTVILAKYPQNLIAAGQYQYPFAFALPEHLPGSFEYYDENNTAYTTYILEARLPAVHSSNEITSSLLLVVNEHAKTLGISKQKENSSSLNSLCCVPRGESTLKVIIPKDSFFTEDSIITNCELDNRRTDLNGKNIRLTLIQNIILKDNYGRIKQLNRIISKLNFRNVYPRREISKFTLELPIIDYDNPTSKFLDRCDHSNLLKNGELVSNLQASCKSDLIKCSYILEIKAFYEAYCISSRTPEVEIPLALHIPDIRVNLNDYMPRNWNPNVQPLNKFDFPLPTAEELGVREQRQPALQEI